MKLLEDLYEFDFHEQYTLSGKRQSVNYGKLLSPLKWVREIQADVGCGRVYTSDFLGVAPKEETPDKRFLLVVDMLPQRGAVYENIPLPRLRICAGRGYFDHPIATGQVIVDVYDMKDRMLLDTIVYDTLEPGEVVRGILRIAGSYGLKAMRTMEYFVGQSFIELQRGEPSLHENLVPLNQRDFETLDEILLRLEFEKSERGYKRQYKHLVFLLHNKTRDSSYILNVQDLMEHYSVVWEINPNDIGKLSLVILDVIQRYNSNVQV